MLKEFAPAGVTITDETVKCNEPIVINGSTYYRGYLANTCNQNVYGNDSPAYGVYSGTGKTGTRYFVQIAGYPANSSQVAIDCKNGWVYSTAPATYYITYLAHEPIKHNISNVTVDIPYVLTAGQSTIIEQYRFPYVTKWGYAAFAINGPPTASGNITLTNGADTINIPLIPSGAYVVEFARPFKAMPTDTITLSTTDGKDAYDLSIALMDA